MNRRHFLSSSALQLVGLAATGTLVGCRGRFGHVLNNDQQDMVGSTTAGAETFKPLIDEAVAKLLARHGSQIETVSHGSLPAPPQRICFVAVENKSAEELGDFKDQIYQLVDTQILESEIFHPVSKRFVDAGLRETRLRPDELFQPQNMQMFSSSLQQQGQPFDYLLYATVTSGTTSANRDYQRDYLLTLELVDINTGDYDKQSASIRKGYHRTRLGKLRHYNPFVK
jgi:hypothetical protein